MFEFELEKYIISTLKSKNIKVNFRQKYQINIQKIQYLFGSTFH